MHNNPSTVDSGSPHLPRTAQLETLMKKGRKVTHVGWGRGGDANLEEVNVISHIPITKHQNKTLSSTELVNIHLT